jgi:hypothetical protein
LELIADPDLRREAGAILEARQIFKAEALALIELHEVQGGLDEARPMALSPLCSKPSAGMRMRWSRARPMTGWWPAIVWSPMWWPFGARISTT